MTCCCSPLDATFIKLLDSTTLYLHQMRKAATAVWVTSMCWRPKRGCVSADRRYTSAAASSFTVNRKHTCSDPFSINTPSNAQTPLLREKYKKMVWLLLVVGGLELNLCCRRAVPALIDRAHVESWHSRLLHSYTVILRGERWTTGNSSYYYYLVCTSRHPD